MMTYQVTQEWSERFGLAHVPLFEVGEIGDPDQHAVLLDGGDGSFILSVGAEACDPQGRVLGMVVRTTPPRDGFGEDCPRDPVGFGSNEGGIHSQ